MNHVMEYLMDNRIWEFEFTWIAFFCCPPVVCFLWEINLGFLEAYSGSCNNSLSSARSGQWCELEDHHIIMTCFMVHLCVYRHTYIYARWSDYLSFHMDITCSGTTLDYFNELSYPYMTSCSPHHSHIVVL